jgi:3-oxoacyl-[acyl-carrier-protein] synthase I
MTAQPLAIVGSGMVCGVGLSAPASCAAIRCALDNFQETRFMDSGGEWIIGSCVPLEQPWRGIPKLVKMLAMALRECIGCNPGIEFEKVPVLICVAEASRPGRLEDLDNQVFGGVQEALGIPFHGRSGIIAQGRAGAATALRQARELIHGEHFPDVIIAGVDSLLSWPTLKAFQERDRLLTSQNSNGFIPGEAAAAVLVQPAKSGQDGLLCTGLGFGQEKATVETENTPLRADGLVAAIRGALAEAGCDLGATDFRITDVSGEQYYFKEAALALSRILRQRKEVYDIWHPADSIGEVGAAIGPAILTVLLAAMRKGYAPGYHVLAHTGSDDGLRSAMALRYQSGRAL